MKIRRTQKKFVCPFCKSSICGEFLYKSKSYYFSCTECGTINDNPKFSMIINEKFDELNFLGIYLNNLELHLNRYLIRISNDNSENIIYLESEDNNNLFKEIDICNIIQSSQKLMNRILKLKTWQ